MRYDVDTIRESGFYSSNKWKKVRDFVKKRDKMVCQRCGSWSEERYEVDHITELTWDNVDDWNVAYNPDNLQLLCHNCHTKKTREDKRGANRLFF